MLARISSPLEDKQLYYVMAAETATQLKKRMFLVAISERSRVGCYEIDLKDKRNVTKQGQQAKGMGAALFKTVLDKVYADLRAIHPTGE